MKKVKWLKNKKRTVKGARIKIVEAKIRKPKPARKSGGKNMFFSDKGPCASLDGAQAYYNKNCPKGTKTSECKQAAGIVFNGRIKRACVLSSQ